MSSRQRPKRETSSDSLSSLSDVHFLDQLMAPPPPRSTRPRRPSTATGQPSTTSQPAPPPPATTSPASASKKRKHPSTSDPHYDDLFGPTPSSPSAEVIDLVDTDKAPPAPSKPPPPKNEIRLSAFQCVICMDDVTNLTVTHCGTSPPPRRDG
jgi:hypothetical protein